MGLKRVMIVGVGNPVPSFILRKLRILDSLGQPLIIVASPDAQRVFTKFKNARLVTFRKLTWSSSLHFLWLLVASFLSRPRTLWSLSGGRSIPGRIRWFLENLQLTRQQHVSVVHLQWIGMASSHGWIGKFYRVPVIASARGSQVTVYSETDAKYREAIRRDLQISDYIHCVSQDILRRCESLCSVGDKAFVNYNGIDSRLFVPVLRVHSSELRLITVGRLVWGKNLISQLLTMGILHRRGIEAHLTIVGEGEEREYLSFMTGNLGLTKYVTLTGRLNESELISRLQQSDVYLSTSVAEGLANSVVEAAACGLPSVVFKCQGMAELIEDGKTGYIVEVGDHEGLANRICQLSDPSHRETMSKLLRQTVVERFNESFWAKKLIEQYEHVARN